MNQNDMMLQYLMEMGSLNQGNEEMAQRQAQIDALRKMRRVDTGMQGGGRIQTAASPLAHMANAMNDMRMNSRQDALDADRKKMGESRMETLRRMVERQQQQQVMPTAPVNADAQAFRDMTGGLY